MAISLSMMDQKKQKIFKTIKTFSYGNESK